MSLRPGKCSQQASNRNPEYFLWKGLQLKSMGQWSETDVLRACKWQSGLASSHSRVMKA
jgi:hypothetical protein